MAATDLARRDFLRRLPVLGAGLPGALSALTLPGCAGVPYLAPTPSPEGLRLSSDAARPTGAFLQTREMERPVYLHRSDSGEWIAVLATCTHQGCQPDPVGDRLVCPCHGSEFTLAGEVLQGPADRPLTRYLVEDDAGELLVRIPGTGR